MWGGRAYCICGCWTAQDEVGVPELLFTSTEWLILWCVNVFELSEHLPYNEGLRDCLDEDKYFEKKFRENFAIAGYVSLDRYPYHFLCSCIHAFILAPRMRLGLHVPESLGCHVAPGRDSFSHALLSFDYQESREVTYTVRTRDKPYFPYPRPCLSMYVLFH